MKQNKLLTIISEMAVQTEPTNILLKVKDEINLAKQIIKDKILKLFNRFPQLNCSSCVQVVAKLRIKYGSKELLSTIAEKLGFWDFIRDTPDNMRVNKKKLLEDVCESFFGGIFS